MESIITRRLLMGAGLGLVVSVAAVSIVMDRAGDAKAGPAAAAPAPAVPVSVVTVKPQDVTTWQEFSGRLEAVDRVDLRSRVAGAILAVSFREGALVKKGDLLIKIDPAPYEAAVAEAQAQVSAAQARVELTKLELERGRKLIESRTVSQSALDQRRSAYHEADAALRSAKAALQSAQLDLDHTEIRAPISGRVGKRQITVGNLVAAGAGSPVLTTLVSTDPIYASFDVSEQVFGRALSELPSGDGGMRPIERIPVEIETVGAAGGPIHGHLQFVNNRVDTGSGTVQARAAFDNPDGLLIPGQFVRVRIGQPKPQPQLLISEKAIGADQDKRFVLVVGKNNQLSYRQVELGDWVNGLRVVASGLKPGERVVVDGLQRVRSGAFIDPQPSPTSPVEQASAAGF
jgi:multidrug efflux system membrane fusion protein